MELFNLPNEILFCIFDYIKDINSFVCSHKDGYKINNYITNILNNFIDGNKISYKYPNLKTLDGFINMHNSNDIIYFNLDKVCINLEFSVTKAYLYIYSYIRGYLCEEKKSSYIEFNFRKYYDVYNDDNDDYLECSRYIDYYNFTIDKKILKLELFPESEEDINYIKNTINILVSNNIIDSIETKGYMINLLPFILNQKVNRIKVDTHHSCIREYIESEEFMVSMATAIINVEDVLLLDVFKDMNSMNLFKEFMNKIFNIVKSQDPINYEKKGIGIKFNHKSKETYVKLYYNSKFLMT
ncbi:Hypothetical protein ORPV_1073 [Orpheovirus IHUMI-LCC2]|uniref:F-box domain-containing protein n=1 Tax=Orpheovirus IHUMI-LCC2 TaxID=2023057 RepID=A0A2I2L624_9VIRU|nr:Hypothetical protein ORPV_1073 [Orpheovirus IHUMI-LCC2]SNW62977.1 Hypothetical protein ORPV_1073 [Orpheovirus IHUMI-LCC2]